MHSRSTTKVLLVILLLLVSAAIYYLSTISQPVNGALEASGTVEAVQVIVSPELAGRVSEVLAAEGQLVQAGQPLYRLDGELLQAQRKQALAALESAQAGVDTAQASLAAARAARTTAETNQQAAQVRYDAEVAAARAEAGPARKIGWQVDQPADFEQPAWYFSDEEELSAAGAEVDRAHQSLSDEQANLDAVLKNASSGDFLQAEKDLAEARSAFLLADQVLDQANASGDDDLEDQAQSVFDAAEADLDEAQSRYDQPLTSEASANVLEARARQAVARAIYEAALDRLNSLRTGEHSYRVLAAQAALDQTGAALQQADAAIDVAEAAVKQAEKGAAQAQSQVDLIDTQISKLTVVSPLAGTVLTRSVEPGETVQPGASTFTLGQLDSLTITVYVNEDRYGQVTLGEHARMSVDSFPGESFDGVVASISDQAEFTPRNVQTEEGRRTTVFAVRLSLSDATGRLKPGMPATVTFSED